MQLLRHTLAYLPAQLLGPVLQLACVLVLTHVLGAADYGVAMLVFATQELVFLACLSWWTSFYLRYGGTHAAALAGGGAAGTGNASGADGARTLAAVEVAIVLASTAAQVVVTVAVLALAGAPLEATFLAAACAFTVTRSALGFLAERARRRAAFVAYTAVQVLAPAGGLALTLLAMRAQALSPAAVLALFALAQAVIAAVAGARLGLAVAPAAPPRAVLRAALAFGAPVVLANALSWVGTNGIRFVVQYGAGAAALGLLSVGWGLATRLTGVAAMLVNAAAYPLAVRAMERGDAAGAQRQIAGNALLLWALLLPTAVAVAVLAQPLAALLVAPEYRAATVAVLPWAAAGAALRNVRIHGWDSLYMLHEVPRRMVVLDAAEAAVTVAGAALGLWAGGMVGAVIGTTVATVIVAVGDAGYLRRRFGLVLHATAVVRVALAAALMGAALAWAGRHGWDGAGAPAGDRTAPVLALLGAAALGMAVYALALAVLFPRAVAAGWRWVRAATASRAGAKTDGGDAAAAALGPPGTAPTRR